MVAILCGCGTLVLGDCAIVAQAGPPAPGVRVARDPRLYLRVWPADVNRDGTTDLVSSATTTAGASGNVQVSIGNGDGTFTRRSNRRSAGS